jgi:hypothetical protein
MRIADGLAAPVFAMRDDAGGVPFASSAQNTRKYARRLIMVLLIGRRHFRSRQFN